MFNQIELLPISMSNVLEKNIFTIFHLPQL